MKQLIIGIMSDTHDHVDNTLKAIDVFIERKVERIIHLGDIISPFIPRFIKRKLDEKNYNVDLVTVLGNNDGDVYLLSKIYSEYGWILLSNPSIIEIENKKFYIMHGFNGVDFTEKIAKALLEKLDVNGVLYGHTHRLKKEYFNNKLLLNPGEVCGYLTGKSTIAILDTDTLTVEIIEL